MSSPTTNSKKDVLIFQNFEHALRAHHDLGELQNPDDLCVGIRLHSGTVVVIPRPTGADAAAWDAHGHLIPHGGAAIVTTQPVADLAARLAPRAGLVRRSLDDLVAGSAVG